LATSPKALIRI